MKARGKREEAECVAPGCVMNMPAALKGRNPATHISALQALALLDHQPGATRFALAPGFHILRLRR